jgi:hypothetical protein
MLVGGWPAAILRLLETPGVEDHDPSPADAKTYVWASLGNYLESTNREVAFH